MKDIALLYAAYGAMGLGCLLVVFGLLGRRNWQAKLDRERARAMGTVVGHAKKTNGSRGRPICHPIIRFRVDGVERESEWNTPAVAEEWLIGREVELLYDPDHPEHIHLADEEGESPPHSVMRTGVIWIAVALAAVLLIRFIGGDSEPKAPETFDGRRAPIVQTGSADSDGFRFYSDSNINCTLTEYSGDEKVVSVPVFADGKFVTVIGMGAFAGQRHLREVSIPGTVRRISTSAFSGCLRLETVNIQDGVQEIGPGAFDLCASLRDVTLPASLNDISSIAFGKDCKAVFHVVSGSYAEDWCRALGFRVDVTDGDGV